MAKKERIVIHREGDVDAIDQELEDALGRLEGANERICSLLETIEVTNQADAKNGRTGEGGEGPAVDEDGAALSGQGPSTPGEE